MKRKPVPKEEQESIVEQGILESAKRSLASESGRRPRKCVVCGSDVAPNSSEGLCWVCRRLKISAWRDQDHQLSAPE